MNQGLFGEAILTKCPLYEKTSKDNLQGCSSDSFYTCRTYQARVQVNSYTDSVTTFHSMFWCQQLALIGDEAVSYLKNLYVRFFFSVNTQKQ